MKKLMIAAAIVCAAAMSQAASIGWKSNSMALTDADGTPISALDSGSLVLVVMSSATGWDSAIEIPTGTASEQTSLSISAKTSSKGQVSGTVKFFYDPDNTAENLINNGDYLALMFKDGDGILNQLTYTSGPDDGNPVAAAYLVSGIDTNAKSLTGQLIPMSGNFTAESVPEPTSGLLLLLGVAGLALRRRRA